MSKKQDLIAKIKNKSTKSAGGGSAAVAAKPKAAAPARAADKPKAKAADPRVHIEQERPNAKMRMFAFHPAGVAKSLYKDWPYALPEDVEICAIQLPGREERLSETPYRDFFPMIQAVTQAILPYSE